MQIQIPNNWSPRPYQSHLWNYMEQGGKRAVALCHRRWGKDEVALHFIATQAMLKPATYWHLLPSSVQARKAIWLAVNPHTGKRRIDEAFPLEIRKRTNDAEMFIEFVTGSFYHVLGSDNYDNFVGSPPAGIVFSEWALANPAAWGYVEPILLENNGWAMFVYTSRGKNHGYNTAKLAEKSDHWFYENQTVAETNVFTEEGLAQAKESLIAIYGEDHGEMIYQQEYFNSFEGGMLGSYYAVEMANASKEGRITTVPYEPNVPVNVYFDLGNAPNLTMWFGQYVGLEPRVIDYEQPTITGVEEINRILRDKRYNYNELVLPHDGGHKQMGDSLGREYCDILEDATRIPTRVLERTDLLPGISEVYSFLRKCWIDEKRCDKGIEALYSYKREWNDKMKKFNDKPQHDWASHPADGFRYMAVDMQQNSFNPYPTEIRVNTDI